MNIFRFSRSQTGSCPVCFMQGSSVISNSMHDDGGECVCGGESLFIPWIKYLDGKHRLELHQARPATCVKSLNKSASCPKL